MKPGYYACRPTCRRPLSVVDFMCSLPGTLLALFVRVVCATLVRQLFLYIYLTQLFFPFMCLYAAIDKPRLGRAVHQEAVRQAGV